MVRSDNNSSWIYVAVMGGFALVNNNKVTILVNEAELGSVCFLSMITLILLIFYIFGQVLLFM